MSFCSPGVSEGGSGPSAQRDLEDSALTAAPGALQMPLLLMDVLSPGRGRLLCQCAPSQAPGRPCWGHGCWGSAVPPAPCGAHTLSSVSTFPLRCGHLAFPSLLPGLMQVLCHSRNLAHPSDRFVNGLVTERQGHVTNEHIQQAECLQSLIESVHNWELMWLRHTPCTNKDLPFKNPRLLKAAGEEQPQCPVPRWGAASGTGAARDPAALQLPSHCSGPRAAP